MIECGLLSFAEIGEQRTGGGDSEAFIGKAEAVEGDQREVVFQRDFGVLG